MKNGRSSRPGLPTYDAKGSIGYLADFRIGVRGGGGKRKDGKVLASSEALLIVILSFLRAVRDGSSAPLLVPRLRMTSAFLP